VFCALSIVLVRRELTGTLDAGLRRRAIDVAQLAVTAPALLTNPGALESPVSGRQIAVEVVDARGRIIARSLTLGARILPLDPLVRAAIARGRTGYENRDIGGRTFRVFAAPIARAGGEASGGAVLVASDVTDIHSTLDHLRLVLIIAGLAVALAATAIVAGLTTRALRPLRRLADSAAEIERTADPARRLPEPATGDELDQLAGVLNRMLASLERAREGERRFLADASHELRTPVTSLSGNVEYLARHGAVTGTDAEVLEDLRRDASRLARLVDDLLALEREGAGGAGLRPLALDELVTATIEELGRGADRVRADHLEAVRVEGDPDALGRAVSNLIENALVHGPDGGLVHVTVDRNGRMAYVRVRDEGPGPAPEDRERLFERFWRGPAAAERPGSGLGLSIVAAIAARHRGHVAVDGSAFTIELPVASRQAEGQAGNVGGLLG
jgi:two-component system sensor histidine kinase MprB